MSREERIDALLAIKSNYEKKLVNTKKASSRLQHIVTTLLGNPLVTVPNFATQFQVSFPTAKSAVEKLIGLGILSKSSRVAYPQYYIADEFFKAAYAEDE